MTFVTGVRDDTLLSQVADSLVQSMKLVCDKNKDCQNMNFIQSCITDEIQPWNEEPSHIPHQFLAKQPPRPKRPKTSQHSKVAHRPGIALEPNTVYFIQHQTQQIDLKAEKGQSQSKRKGAKAYRPLTAFSNLLDNKQPSGLKSCKSALLPCHPGTSPESKRSPFQTSKKSLQFRMIQRNKQEIFKTEKNMSHHRPDFTINLRQKYGQSVNEHQRRIQEKLKRHEEGGAFPIKFLATQQSNKGSSSPSRVLNRLSQPETIERSKTQSLKRESRGSCDKKMGLHLALERKVFLMRQKVFK